MNKCMFAGNLTRDPETRSLDSGKSVTTFGVALNENYTSKTGEKVKHAEFINCEAWSTGGELIAKYLKKGDGIIITDAKVKTETWEKDGQRRNATKFNVLHFEFPPNGGKRDRDAVVETDAEGVPAKASRKAVPAAEVEDDGGIPF